MACSDGSHLFGLQVQGNIFKQRKGFTPSSRYTSEWDSLDHVASFTLLAEWGFSRLSGHKNRERFRLLPVIWIPTLIEAGRVTPTWLVSLGPSSYQLQSRGKEYFQHPSPQKLASSPQSCHLANLQPLHTQGPLLISPWPWLHTHCLVAFWVLRLLSSGAGKLLRTLVVPCCFSAAVMHMHVLIRPVAHTLPD